MKDFFSNFPTVSYELDGIKNTVANIAIGEIVIRYKTDMSYVIWKHETMDDDTPVSISKQVYGTTEYYWTILYINNIVNPYTDWYMSQTELERYVDACYSDGKNGLHHFERRISENDYRVLDDVDHAASLVKYQAKLPLGEAIFPVTNLMYEKRLNDARKSIRIISPKFIVDFANSFHRILDGKA